MMANPIKIFKVITKLCDAYGHSIWTCRDERNTKIPDKDAYKKIKPDPKTLYRADLNTLRQ
jgi:hypothetical protein